MESEQKCETPLPHPNLVLKILVVVVDENRIEKVNTYLLEHVVRLQYVCAGRGTANSEILDMLGLNGSEKALVFCLLPDFQAETMLKTMLDALHLEKNGHGIAFTLPMSGIGKTVLNIFNDETMKRLTSKLPQGVTPEMVRERMEQYMENEPERMINDEIIRHELIVAVVNQGCADELVETAKEAGARGGTVINARRTGLDDGTGTTFLGMPVQAQKDIVMILTDRKQKVAIMKAISHDYGLNTDARGIVFSLPVDSVAGLRTGQ